MRLMPILIFILTPHGALLAEPPAAVPATQPTSSGPDTVLIMPFAPLGDASRIAWVGQAVQQNMANELSRMRSMKVVPAAQAPAQNDAKSVRKAAAEAGAAYVVFGSFQIVEPDLRITGELLDVRTGQSLAGLKATGALRDLFDMEDTLAAQVRRTLTASQAAPAGPAAGVAATTPPAAHLPLRVLSLPAPCALPIPGKPMPLAIPLIDGWRASIVTTSPITAGTTA